MKIINKNGKDKPYIYKSDIAEFLNCGHPDSVRIFEEVKSFELVSTPNTKVQMNSEDFVKLLDKFNKNYKENTVGQDDVNSKSIPNRTSIVVQNGKLIKF